jgi:signal transduction histidine kinase
LGTEDDEVDRSLKLLEANHHVIATGSNRIAKIIESLKSFSRLDEALFQEMDIHESIDITLTLLQHELGDRVAIVKDYGELPRISGYPNELNQMFMNLLSNAIQAIEDQGTIRISSAVEEAGIIVKISDTGKGIPQDHLSRIFDPGFTGMGVGKGLGLSIVYNIIQKHQGEISINSEIGKGTEVTITLPLKQQNPFVSS